MSRLIETLRLKDGKLFNVEYHQQRMNTAFQNLFPNTSCPFLKDFIQSSSLPDKGLYKVRLIYNCKSMRLEYSLYQQRFIRSLQITTDNQINYSYKWEDRKYLNCLFSQKGSADDILIVKNGQITDTSFSNIIFYDGKEWFTPANPLLRGTQRQFLIDHKQIKEAEIEVRHLKIFKQAGLINAMIPMEEMPLIAIENIRINE